MNEEIKNYIREWTGNKGDDILLDLNRGTHYVMDNIEKEYCYLCTNHTFLMQTHHINKNPKDDNPKNLMRICEFCHQHGIHGNAFKLREVGIPEIDNDICLLLEGLANDNLVFSENISGSLWIEFMESDSLVERVSEVRYYLRATIGVWHYEHELFNKVYRESPNYQPIKETANKLRAWQEMMKATHRLKNESRKK